MVRTPPVATTLMQPAPRARLARTAARMASAPSVTRPMYGDVAAGHGHGRAGGQDPRPGDRARLDGPPDQHRLGPGGAEVADQGDARLELAAGVDHGGQGPLGLGPGHVGGQVGPAAGHQVDVDVDQAGQQGRPRGSRAAGAARRPRGAGRRPARRRRRGRRRAAGRRREPAGAPVPSSSRGARSTTGRGVSGPVMWSVGEGGLEPPRPCGHRNLNPARLPIPPLAQGNRGRIVARP